MSDVADIEAALTGGEPTPPEQAPESAETVSPEERAEWYRESRVNINEMVDGNFYDQAYYVKSVEKKTQDDGRPFIVFGLGDKTGKLEAVAWSDYLRLESSIEVGVVVRARGTRQTHPKFGGKLVLVDDGQRVHLRGAEPEEYNADKLVPGPAEPFDDILGNFNALVNSVSDPYLTRVLDYFFDGSENREFWDAFVNAPAAKRVHQAYRHGLIEHTTSVAQSVAMLSGKHSNVNRDMAVAGALLHDIGKVHVYKFVGIEVEMTTKAMLHGEVMLTYGMVNEAVEAENVPEQTALALLHIIASHHGKLEHGALALPSTPEAMLVHMVDNLGARLGSFERVQAETRPTDEWSVYDRILETRVWMGERAGADEA